MLCKQKDIKEIYNKVWNELKKEEYHPEFQQFLQWQYHVAAYILKENRLRILYFRIKNC